MLQILSQFFNLAIVLCKKVVKKMGFCLADRKNSPTFALAIRKDGGIAQLVRAHDS